MEAILAIFRPGSAIFHYPIVGDITMVGRQEDCDIRISHLDVSRKHCRLIKENDTLELEDLGSSNGTFLNGVRVSEKMIEAGDVIRVGPVKFVVQIDGEPRDEELAADSIEPAADAKFEGFPFVSEDDEKDDLVDFNPDEWPNRPEDTAT